MLATIQKYAKALVALLGALLTAGTTLIPAEWAPYLSLVLAIATAIATMQVPNTDPTKPGDGDVLVAGDGLGDDGQPKHAAS
ncbi:hypothetical protein [Curtobacterium sp. MEB011]|uniref:hypothetical protein n=1 Tax=Curtobacterium sp. MEB011 TaxID=3040285 RepID=UPI00254FB890|nr:hypothetical protein [Curtobacterium sp. MEB011]